MFKLDQIESPALKRFLVEIPAGQHLFKQNDRGNTFYIIMDGKVKLTHKVMQTETVVTTLGAGEIVGEKAVCVQGPYKRAFSAIAETDVKVLEIDSQSLKTMVAKLPDFSNKLLQVVVERLDKANQVLGILRLKSPVERVVQYLIFLASLQTGATAKEFSITADSLSESVNISKETAQQALDELIGEKIFTQKENLLILNDENALLQYMPTLKERLAA
jgi:CRP-like cAMP-binding protein